MAALAQAPQVADLVSVIGIALSGIYGLAMIPVTPALIAAHPMLLETLSGSIPSIVAASAFSDVDSVLQIAVVVAVALPGLMKFDFGHVRQRGLFGWDGAPSVQAEAGDATAVGDPEVGPNPGLRCARAASDQAGVPSGSKASASSGRSYHCLVTGCSPPLQADQVPPHKQAAYNRPAADADPRMPPQTEHPSRSSGGKVTSIQRSRGSPGLL